MNDKEIIDYCFSKENEKKEIRQIAKELNLYSAYVGLVLQDYFKQNVC
jgi:hypothetical protein